MKTRFASPISALIRIRSHDLYESSRVSIESRIKIVKRKQDHSNAFKA